MENTHTVDSVRLRAWIRAAHKHALENAHDPRWVWLMTHFSAADMAEEISECRNRQEAIDTLTQIATVLCHPTEMPEIPHT